MKVWSRLKYGNSIKNIQESRTWSKCITIDGQEYRLTIFGTSKRQHKLSIHPNECRYYSSYRGNDLHMSEFFKIVYIFIPFFAERSVNIVCIFNLFLGSFLSQKRKFFHFCFTLYFFHWWYYFFLREFCGFDTPYFLIFLKAFLETKITEMWLKWFLAN